MSKIILFILVGFFVFYLLWHLCKPLFYILLIGIPVFIAIYYCFTNFISNNDDYLN